MTSGSFSYSISIKKHTIHLVSNLYAKCHRKSTVIFRILCHGNPYADAGAAAGYTLNNQPMGLAVANLQAAVHIPETDGEIGRAHV